jgi:hypothetical protein
MTRKVSAKLSYTPSPNLAGMYAAQAAQAKAAIPTPESAGVSLPEPPPPAASASQEKPRKKAKKSLRLPAPSPKSTRPGRASSKPDLRVRRTIRIPKSDYQKLQAIAERRGIPINALILAALAAVCRRSSGS